MEQFLLLAISACFGYIVNGQPTSNADNSCVSSNTLRDFMTLHSTPWPCQKIWLGNNTDDFDVYGCEQEHLENTDDHFTLSENPDAGSRANSACVALFRPTFSGLGSQKISVNLWNEIGQGTADLGFPGVVFNAKDEDNFDAFYIRTHSTEGCYNIAHVRHGDIVVMTTGVCPEGPPTGRTWFLLEVFVEVDRAVIYLNGQVVVRMKPNFSFGGQIGILLWNGYQNTIFFQDLSVTVKN